MRLIDADVLKGCKILQPYKGETDGAFIREIELEDIPTAYDVEKVLEQLNEESFYSIEYGRCNANYRAIEIVRKGGVE